MVRWCRRDVPILDRSRIGFDSCIADAIRCTRYITEVICFMCIVKDQHMTP